MNKPKRWTEEELDYLKRNYKTATYEEMELYLGKSVSAIKQKAYDLQLNKKFWTLDEVRFLRENYKNMPMSELEKKLGKTPNAIKLKASRLGINKYNCYSRW